MPLVGFGTYKINTKHVIHEVIDESLKVGFRSIDTAAVYRNEEDIGCALKILLPKYNLQRSDIFITTKLGAARIPESSKENVNLRIKTWSKLVELQMQGLIRSIGVSNYTTKHLDELLENCRNIPPAVNQVECHPHYRQEELIKYCNDKGIHIQAYSSLGTSSNTNLLNDPVVTTLSSELNVSPARLLLKWSLQQGIGIIPKAIKKKHIQDNIKLDFDINMDKMKILSSLPQQKYAWDPLNIDLILNGSKSSVFSLDDSQKILMNNNVSFHFFSSQAPCGDCSIFPKKSISNKDMPPVKMRKLANDNKKEVHIMLDLHSKLNTKVENNTKEKIIEDIYRTGAKCVKTEEKQDLHLPGVNYHTVGPLRIKPGRGDPTLSLSCSDKMAKWNVLGLQGALLSLLIPQIRMKSITIGGDTPFSLEAMKRGLCKRFGKDVNDLVISQASLPFMHKKGQQRINACPSSIIWCAVRKRDTEIAVEGRKQGATKKKKGSSLAISRKALFETFLQTCDKYNRFWDVRHPKKITYLNCKQWSEQYQYAWKGLRRDSLRTWPSKPQHLQDFIL
ncbi:hypothetical protein KM043_002222 [Ampulex compressa]|nr:hypothetical protein KM043_002222 [Ampulex compressa]